LQKNKSLKTFYDKVYLKGEEDHFTWSLLLETPMSDIYEVLKEISWKSKKVLDVGCGTGFFAFKAAKKGANVLGIDFSKEAIAIAKKKYTLRNLKFENLDVKKITGKYDIIVSIGTLEHMKNPLHTLKLLKNYLNPSGKIIVTSPNWTNPRGYILLTLWFLFNAPITLADLHYQTPIDFMNYAKKLNLNIKWRTINRSWAHGKILIKDFEKRLPNVLKNSELPYDPKKVKSFIRWLKENVLPLDNSLPQSGAIGLYVLSKKIKKTKTH